jgi:DNA-binding beta-propeller fold protein YncE
MPLSRTDQSHPSLPVRSAGLQFEVEPTWGRLPPGWSFVEVAGVATDSQDRVYVFNRGEQPVVIFDSVGRLIGAWGKGLFIRPHGITIGPDDSVYCVDDSGHVVYKFNTDGTLIQTIGTGRPSDTGATSVDYRSIQRSGPPFHYPTNLAIARSGDLYISDGYGNARIHKFSPDGTLLHSWGQPGSGPGEFHLPHGIAVDQESRIYVADRENSRIQIFNSDGGFLDEWTDVARPCQVALDARGYVYVAELGFRAGMWPGMEPPSPDATGGRVSIFDHAGRLAARWGGGANPCAPGDFFAPHDIAIDSRGDVYVGEVTMSAGGNRGVVPANCHCLQKFTRKLPL